MKILLFVFIKIKIKMNENKLYTVVGIIGLLGIVSFVIYIIGSFIYLGVKTNYDISNRPTTYIDSCDDANMLEPDNESSPPVKGMKVNNITFTRQQIDSINNIVKLNSSFVDREINDGLTSGKVYK